MITFKRYLVESRSAPLYHATSLPKAVKILTSDVMFRSKYGEPGLRKPTVSLTRSFVFARNWIRETTVTNDGGVIFEINQNKLTQRHKIIPYSYFGTPDIGHLKSARDIPRSRTFTAGKDYTFENQFEEAVLSDIHNFSKYITTVHITSNSSLFEKIEALCREKNIPVKKIDG